MTSWRIVADDLTGALDSAAAFSGPRNVPVFLGRPEPHDMAVCAVATATRDVPSAALPELLSPCLDWLAGAGMTFKKIDSLVRGNTFAEVCWLARAGGFEGVVFAPAFPAQSRFTRRGRHWVGNTSNDSVDQERIDSVSLPDRFAQQGMEICYGPTLEQCAGAPVMIPDICSDGDLAALAVASGHPQAQRWLWCGSAGLAWAMAKHWRLAPTSPSYPQGALPILIVTASRHQVLRSQLDYLAAADVIPVRMTINESLPRGAVTVLDLAPTAPLPQEQADAELARQAARVVDAQEKPGTLIVIGGDTLLALCRASGTHALAASSFDRSGWGRARLVGGRWDGVQCLTRSGAFGAVDDLTTLLASLTLKENQ